MLNSKQPITRDTWNVIVDYLIENGQVDAVDAACSLTERQGQQLYDFIARQKNAPGTLNAVLADLKGFTTGDDMYVPVSSKSGQEGFL